MYLNQFPVIDLPATGANIRRLRQTKGLTVRDLQQFFGFDEPQAIYKWQRGQSLPTVDNLYALSTLIFCILGRGGHGEISKPLRPLSAASGPTASRGIPILLGFGDL